MPVEVRPHACVALALSIAKVRLPVTSVGARRLMVPPVPSSPRPLAPQQYTAPADVSAQLWSPPALIAVKLRVPATATGAACGTVSPVPSTPKPFEPQQ